MFDASRFARQRRARPQPEAGVRMPIYALGAQVPQGCTVGGGCLIG